MKLVLNFSGQEPKLYAEELTFEGLTLFIQKKFNLKSSNLHITFLDDENDNISVMSQDDFEVMLSCNEGKDYVSISIEGETVETALLE